MTVRILIVDDDPIQCRLLEEVVKRFGYYPMVANGGEQALSMLNDPQFSDVALMILDLVMPDLDGMAVLTQLQNMGRSLPVIVQTSKGGIDTVVSAMRAGAFDFAVKPISPERLHVSIKNALKVTALEGEITRIKRSAEGRLTFKDIITDSPTMERVLRLGERASKSNIPILLEGESGVGKELIARAIQGTGTRRAKPFITVNCGAIPENLVESILFGHEKGAFTGANERHIGKFQEAHGGTLFLDEVGELPLDIQVKLLRALQEGEIDPVGARRPIKVDLKLISATNKSLLDMVKEGKFREDLYYRLNVYPIWVPPLRERREDIPKLARHFAARFAAEEGKTKIINLTQGTLQLLQNYSWPGNIRQLENAVFRAVVLCDTSELTVDEFPQIAAQVDGFDIHIPSAPKADVNMFPSPNFSSSSYSADQLDLGFAYGTLSGLDDSGEMRTLETIEEEFIRFAITHYRGRMSEIARRLGIGRSTLYRKLKDYNIDPDAKTAA